MKRRMAYGRKEQQTSTPEENLVVKNVNLEETIGKVFTFNGVNHTMLLAIVRWTRRELTG